MGAYFSLRTEKKLPTAGMTWDRALISERRKDDSSVSQ
jgi:hypothetical protein